MPNRTFNPFIVKYILFAYEISQSQRNFVN
jgi:hypothetical protein